MGEKTYSKKEIEDDIFNFEKVKISLKIECVANKLYSEFYESPMDDDSTIDELKNRIEEYLQQHGQIVK